MSAGIFNDTIKPRTIYYRKGYKYQLAKGYTIILNLQLPADIFLIDQLGGWYNKLFLKALKKEINERLKGN